MSNSDKHCAYLEDPDDIDLNNEFNGLNEDEVENLKREYVVRICLFCLVDSGHMTTAKLGTQPRSHPRTQPPRPQLPEEN